MTQATIDLIRNAIRAKQPIEATYDGYYRVLCPHVIGYKNGTVNLLAYQSGGDSSRGAVPTGSGHAGNWRCMRVDALQGVTLSSGAWATADNHSQRSSCVDQILEQVSF